MTTASKITLVRVLMIPVFMALLLLGYNIPALIVFIVASCTDFVDHPELSVPEMVDAMEASSASRSACPSPSAWEELFRKADHVIAMTISGRLSGSYNSAMVGKTVEVLVEGYDRYADCQFGRTYADSPEIDGTIYFTGDAEPGSFAMVKVTDVEDGELSGMQI